MENHIQDVGVVDLDRLMPSRCVPRFWLPYGEPSKRHRTLDVAGKHEVRPVRRSELPWPEKPTPA